MNYASKFLLFFLISIISIHAQVKDYELGLDPLAYRGNIYGGYYDYSNPETINISVSVWGWVRFPGRYKVPISSTVGDLLSFSGGPSDAARLEDLRIYRVAPDSTESLILFSYNDVVYESNLKSKYGKVPKLEAGDILLVPGEPRLYDRDYFSIWMSVISVLTSLTILIYNIVKH
ncbi:MAG: SLBB domain-containing protein [Ignavibacteriales bacterium]|nr:SLBB domain-containing protein [Ignavibacteriales bacterium]